jgi:hypothetical protein
MPINANGSLFGEPFVYFLLHLAFGIIIQLPLLFNGGPEDPPDQPIDHPALSLEKPAYRAARQVDGQLNPFFKGQRRKLSFLDKISRMPAVVLYFLYHSHSSGFYDQVF